MPEDPTSDLTASGLQERMDVEQTEQHLEPVHEHLHTPATARRYRLGFTRWVMVNFTSREHYIRFLATWIVAITVYFIVRNTTVPEGWWGIFGMVVGYFFRGHTEPEEKPKP